MPRITNKQDVKVGHYYTYCCELDLLIIESESEKEYVVEDMDDDCLPSRVWDTKEEALKELLGKG